MALASKFLREVYNMITACGIYSLIMTIVLLIATLRNNKEKGVNIFSIIIIAPVIFYIAFNLFRSW